MNAKLVFLLLASLGKLLNWNQLDNRHLLSLASVNGQSVLAQDASGLNTSVNSGALKVLPRAAAPAKGPPPPLPPKVPATNSACRTSESS